MDKRKRAWLIAIAGAVVASVWYRVTVFERLEQTSALFIGIPALIAAICVLTPKPASATGTAVKAVTLFIGISGVFLGEGLICILMASPLFYLIAIVIGCVVDKDRKNSTIVSCVLFLTMIPISSEGTRPGLSFSRDQTVSAESVLTATPEQIDAALAAPPRTNGTLPLYLRMGFPRPASADVPGTAVGARETIHFAGGEGKPGDLVLEVAEHQKGRLRWRSISDTSHLAHWLKWEESSVEWKAVDGSHTRVRWTLRYRRLLDPAWYFGPWERYAVRLTAEQLIQDSATPR
jgi:hypothetical protein